MHNNKNISARVIGTGSYLPLKILTNKEIETQVPGTNADWTYKKLGIDERRIAAINESTGDLAIKAAEKALEASELDPKDLDLIILGTTTPRRPAPSTACFVQHQLGATNSVAFDISAVCSSFIYGMVIASQFIVSGTYENILVIGADTMSKITDWERRDCVFFGDGAGAAILSKCPEGEGILSFDLGSDGSEDFAWTIPAGGSEQPTSEETLKDRSHFWQMDGKAVYNMAIERLPMTLERSLKIANLTINDIDHIIPHQPSIGILKKTAEIMNIPFEKFHTNMDKYANTSAATVGITLDEAVRSKAVKPNDIIAFAAVGAGWTWGSLIVKWS
ncbi:ketoacyl-ACP synthase III [Patescibacteria group bacterium]|nr:ketoacyl-ACP synthase III [Patescibacteria group bacterium]